MVRILVVDDEDLVRHLCKRILSLEGFEVETAENPSVARELLSRTDPPDLILLDINMPVESGLDFLRYYRRSISQTTPVIMLTGNRYESDVTESFNLGASDYLLKPFMAQEVINRVKVNLRKTGISLESKAPTQEHVTNEDRLLQTLDALKLGYNPESDSERLRKEFHFVLRVSEAVLSGYDAALKNWASLLRPDDIAEATLKVMGDEVQEISVIYNRLISLFDKETLRKCGRELLDRLELLREEIKHDLTDFLVALGMFDEMAAWSQSIDVAARQKAVSFLGFLEHNRARSLLLERMEDPVPEIRTSAARSLSRYCDEEVWNVLVEALWDPSEDVAKAAGWALGQSLPVEKSDLVLSHLTSADEKQKKHIVRILQDRGLFSDFHLFMNILDRDRLQHIAPFLKDDPEFTRELLGAARAGENTDMQTTAMELLDKHHIEGREEVFEKQLHSEEPHVREVALKMIGKNWDGDVQSKVAHLQFDPSSKVRKALVEIYAHLPPEESSVLLTSFLKDVHPEVRGMAACSIFNMGELEALEVLEKMVESEDPKLRSEGLRHLLALGKRVAIKPCLTLLVDPDDSVRNEAERLITNIAATKREENILREFLPLVSEEVKQALSQILGEEPPGEEGEGKGVPLDEFNRPPQQMNTRYLSAYKKFANRPVNPFGKVDKPDSDTKA